MNRQEYEKYGFLILILVLQNTMEAMGNDSQLLPHSFKFPFLNMFIENH